MKVLKIAGAAVAVLAVAIAAAFIGARFSDGPLGMIPGGPLVSGAIEPFFIVDWGRVRNIDTIEMQLVGDDTSRTTWIIEHAARAYIPASLGFPPGKTWYQRADGSEAWLRFGGKRYHVRLEEMKDPAIADILAGKVERKYGGTPPSDAGVMWFRVISLAPIPDIKL